MINLYKKCQRDIRLKTSRRIDNKCLITYIDELNLIGYSLRYNNKNYGIAEYEGTFNVNFNINIIRKIEDVMYG